MPQVPLQPALSFQTLNPAAIPHFYQDVIRDKCYLLMVLVNLWYYLMIEGYKYRHLRGHSLPSLASCLNGLLPYLKCERL